MNVATLNVTPEVAAEALKQYKAHRGVYDTRDWEIERIYRQIARGRKVISIQSAMAAAGLDELGRPKLALCRADQREVRVNVRRQNIIGSSGPSTRINFKGINQGGNGIDIIVPIDPPQQPWARAALPRIPPQHRPAKNLDQYHILWEAEWTALPDDPYLLKRIGKDAWIVLAAWDLTDVELSVLRAHQ